MQTASTPCVSTHRQRASKRVAQLRPAAVGVVPGLGATKDAVEMDVGDVEELHRAKNCMRRVGRTLMSRKVASNLSPVVSDT